MLEFSELCLDSRFPFPVGNTEGIYRNSASHIYIFFPVRAVNDRAVTARYLLVANGVGYQYLFGLSCTEIKKSDIDAVTEPVLDAVVFQITDMISEGKYGQALLKLQQLLKMQQEPLGILGAIGGHFRRLSAARILLDNGRGAADLMKMYRLSDYPARKAMEAARRFKPEFYKKASELILETDYRMKTSFDEPERLLEILILQLAQEARNG